MLLYYYCNQKWILFGQHPLLHAASRSTSSGCLVTWWNLRTLDGLWDQLAHITCTIIHPSNMAMQHDKTVKDHAIQGPHTKLLSKCWFKWTHHSFLSLKILSQLLLLASREGNLAQLPSSIIQQKWKKKTQPTKFNQNSSQKKTHIRIRIKSFIITDSSMVFLFFTGSPLGEFPTKKLSVASAHWVRVSGGEDWQWKKCGGERLFLAWTFIKDNLPSLNFWWNNTKYKIVSKLKMLKCLLSPLPMPSWFCISDLLNSSQLPSSRDRLASRSFRCCAAMRGFHFRRYLGAQRTLGVSNLCHGRHKWEMFILAC